MKRILISGITGFVGKNLKHYLQHKNQIWGTSRNSIEPNHINFDNITEKSEFDIYIHLAGKAHDLRKSVNSQEYYDVNTKLTKKIFDIFLNSKANIFIYLSSVKAVRDNVDTILKEEEIPNPLTDYGKSKRLAEEYILNNLPKNKKVYILRPCMIHGEGNKGNLTLLYNFVKRGIPYPLGVYDNKRSFLSIDNLCFVINEIIERNNIPSGIYNLADDEPVSTKDLIKLICEVTNKKLLIWNIPKFIINFIAKIGDYVQLPLNSERVMKMTENYVVSNQKIKSVLGGNLPVSSEDGLRKTIESFNK